MGILGQYKAIPMEAQALIGKSYRASSDSLKEELSQPRKDFPMKSVISTIVSEPFWYNMTNSYGERANVRVVIVEYGDIRRMVPYHERDIQEIVIQPTEVEIRTLIRKIVAITTESDESALTEEYMEFVIGRVL